jgi:hypothetical protein
VTTFSFAQLEQLWINAGGSKALAAYAAATALVESGGRSDAYNASGASGIWQIEVPLHDSVIPGGAGNVMNPEANARAAVAVSGNTMAGLIANWTVDEPAGAVQAMLAKYGGTAPATGSLPAGSSGSSGSGSSGSGSSGSGSSGDSTSFDYTTASIGGIPFIGPIISGVSGDFNTIGDVAKAITGLTRGLSKFIELFALLFRPEFWVRVGAFILAVGALVGGLYLLKGSMT